MIKSMLLQFNIITEKTILNSIIVLILLAISAIIFVFGVLILNIIIDYISKEEYKMDENKIMNIVVISKFLKAITILLNILLNIFLLKYILNGSYDLSEIIIKEPVFSNYIFQNLIKTFFIFFVVFIVNFFICIVSIILEEEKCKKIEASLIKCKNLCRIKAIMLFVVYVIFNICLILYSNYFIKTVTINNIESFLIQYVPFIFLISKYIFIKIKLDCYSDLENDINKKMDDNKIIFMKRGDI